MRINPIMRGSSSTTRIRLPSRGFERGSLLLIILHRSLIVTEGQREFVRFLGGGQDLDKGNAPPGNDHRRNAIFDPSHLTVASVAGVLSDDGLIRGARNVLSV